MKLTLKGPKMEKLYKNFKLGFVVFLVGLSCGAALMVCNGCGGEELPPIADAGVDTVVVSEDGLPPTPSLLPAKIDPVQACYDIVDWLCSKMSSCTANGSDVDKFAQALLAAWNCPSIIGLRDSVEFYVDCQTDIKGLTCIEFQKADVPPSCQGQLL